MLNKKRENDNTNAENKAAWKNAQSSNGEINKTTNEDIKKSIEITAQTEKDNAKNYTAAQKKEKAKNEKRAAKTAKREKSAADKVHKLALKLQRGANEAAVVQAKQADGFFLGVLINALGQFLYEIGFQAEYFCIKVYRAIKYAVYALGAGFFAILRSVARSIGVFLLGIWRDVTRPAVHFATNFTRAVRHFFSALFRGKNPFLAVSQSLKKGKSKGKNSGLHAISYVLPLCAVAVFTFTVNAALATPFSLAVMYNDEFIGYIESDFVWDDAESKVRSRIRAVSSDQTFQTHPEFEVVSVDLAARLESTELADRIMESSSDQIMQASGVYVGENLVAVTSEGDAIRTLLDTTISISTPAEGENARVSFVHDIYVEDGLYYTESVTSFAQAESTLNTNLYLQTAVTVTQTREVEVPYAEIEEESNQYAKGTSRVGSYGQNGINSLTEDITYIDGVEVSRVVLSETVVKEPVTKITYIGTAEPISGGIYEGEILAGTGALLWPVPAYTGTTTEFQAPERPTHRGLDITAPAGTPIIAADSGTVIESTWHWSWGNYLLISHGNGMTTRYAHCTETYVSAGMNVDKGAVIATVGNTGVSYGNHLHFEVEVNGSLYNPRQYVVQP